MHRRRIPCDAGFCGRNLLSTSSVILIGGPDTGKTNFIGRLWIALRTGEGALTASEVPDEIEYVEEIVAYLHQGDFALRTDKNRRADRLSVTLPLSLNGSRKEEIAELVIPDISGEVWKKAAETNDLAQGWMARLEGAVGALLFVRVLSPLNVAPLDWVTAARLMKHQGDDAQQDKMPTQVMLCEFLRFLELKLPDHPPGRKPRIAVIVTAWDLLDEERAAAGPQAYLQQEYPLFAGRLADLDRFDVMIFAMSVFGGDPRADEEFRDRLLDLDFQSVGFVRFDHNGTVKEESDVTLPIAWAIGARSSL